MVKYKQLPIFIIASMVQFGCSTTAIIEIESTRRADLVGITDVGVVYQLLPSDNLTLSSNLLYEKFTSQVEYVLNELGFVPVSHTVQHKTDITIELSYGISGPISREYSYYDFGSYGNCCSCQPSHCTCTTSYYSQSVGHSSGHTTAVLRTGSYNVYRRTLELVASESGTDDASSPAWKTTATSTGRSDDLEAVFPLLLAAITPYIATNTKNTSVLKTIDELQYLH